jgi:hypothetical protein
MVLGSPGQQPSEDSKVLLPNSEESVGRLQKCTPALLRTCSLERQLLNTTSEFLKIYMLGK